MTVAPQSQAIQTARSSTPASSSPAAAVLGVERVQLGQQAHGGSLPQGAGLLRGGDDMNLARALPQHRPTGRGSTPPEELYGSLMALGRRPRLEGAEIAPLTGPQILLPRIEPVLAIAQLPDHREPRLRRGTRCGRLPRRRAPDRGSLRRHRLACRRFPRRLTTLESSLPRLARERLTSRGPSRFALQRSADCARAHP